MRGVGHEQLARRRASARASAASSSAAATMRLLASSPVATIASLRARRDLAAPRPARSDHASSSAKSGVERREQLRAALRLAHERRHAPRGAARRARTALARRRRLAALGEAGELEQRVRHARERRDHHQPRPLLAAPRSRPRGAHGLRVLDRRAAELHHDQAGPPQSSRPSACISSAFRTDAPAAPRTVLWPSATNFQSSTAHGRSRPTLTVMPRPRAGVEARLRPVRLVEVDERPLGRRRQAVPLRRAAEAVDRRAQRRERGLRVERHRDRHRCGRRPPARGSCARSRAPGAARPPSPASAPRILRVSVSIFSSSPEMKGITLPRMSSEGTPG